MIWIYYAYIMYNIRCTIQIVPITITAFAEGGEEGGADDCCYYYWETENYHVM